MKIGAYLYETYKKQNVSFHIIADLKKPILKAGIKEDMANVFSYDILLDGIKILAHSRHYILLESLAEDIAQFTLQHDEIERVSVRVEKLELGPKAVGIQIERYAHEHG